MKCVLINSWYNQYSTGKLVSSFHNYLVSNNHISHVFYGHGEKSNDNNVHIISSKISLYCHSLLCRITGYQGCYSTKNTKKLINEIEIINPDVVYLFNLHAYYLNEFMLLEYLKNKHVKVIYVLFDEYPYLGKCCFSEGCTKYLTECKNCNQKKTYPKSLFFDRSNYFFNRKKEIYKNWEELTFVGVEFLKQQASKSAITKNINFLSVDMGVELEETYYPREVTQLRERLQIQEHKKVVLTVGPYSDERKGISKFYEISKRCKNDDIIFINIGFDGDSKLISNNFIGIPYVSNQEELACYYSLADIYAITSSGEGMSLTCMEALGCGTKLLGFDISGTPYSASEEFGTFVKYDDLEAFTKAIKSFDKKTEQSINKCRNYALSRYELSNYLHNLEKIGLDSQQGGF